MDPVAPKENSGSTIKAPIEFPEINNLKTSPDSTKHNFDAEEQKSFELPL